MSPPFFLKLLSDAISIKLDVEEGELSFFNSFKSFNLLFIFDGGDDVSEISSNLSILLNEHFLGRPDFNDS